MSFNKKIVAFLQVTRWPNLLIIVLGQYLTAIFLIEAGNWNDVLLSLRMAVLSLSTVILAASGYLINDYYDIKIDYVNKPQKVVIGKYIRRRHAMLAHTTLNFIGITMGLLLNYKVGLVNVFAAYLLWLYSNKLKRLPFWGNFSVAVLTALSIFSVYLIFPDNFQKVLLYSYFGFTLTFIREVIKDMEDIKGDEEFGCRTIPIILGIRATKRVLYVLIIVFTTSCILVCTIYNLYSLGIFFTALSIPWIIFIYQIYRADTQKSYRKLSTTAKLIMLLGLVSMTML
ncbi:geranylgeranylglycerol-phosphate geranylgeranyltransferase [Marinigracilibium pacificum]|uniref:UbiA family prenyltransferase n=1 Tax=Marinigracilibium pacificum TaxID=2729599 RepID=A0A848IZ16_9BACT|nr:geranylgeranylglycerol-phosphate geranylgeranyltransferase [Marinigracilibium pacificum]NMM49773.1 UbiA family prenyltransferase [Marinigracilibium pacificum]